jgi:cyclic-di-GMP phosphodiesterase TipF (flagellum assembly factor)
MVRLAIAAVSLALLCAAAYFAPWLWLSRFWPGAAAVPLFSAIALVVALVAAAASFRAMAKTGKLRVDLLLLARSIDVALRDVAAKTEKETATISEMSGAVVREIGRLSERIATRDDIIAGAQGANADNVVPHPAARRPRAATVVAEGATPALDRGATEAAYRKAVTAGAFDISLQPIVSVSRSAASGFEVFANMPVEGGERIDLRRLAQTLPGVESAVFERILATTALSAGRRRLGAASAAMPLHVAISSAILGDAKELAVLLDMLQFYPDLAASIVLSMPSGVFEMAGQHAESLGLLSAKGVRFAAEDWNDADNVIAAIGAEGLDFLKIPVNRLLDREKQRRKPIPATTILESAVANDVTIIAVDVANDEDAVSLIDLGIDLMAGPRFGGPKRLKQDGGSRPGRLALL